MWKELLGDLFEDCEFHDPTSDIQLDEAEGKLGVKLPEALRGVLKESDGVDGEYGDGLHWPVGRIVEDNLRFRSLADFRELYMPFANLLFFADAGNGDQFAYPIDADGEIRREDVFLWNHEDDSRTWVAPSLRRYFEGWADGSIEV